MSSSTAPNPTLYINNLNDKINKEEIRAQLFALFMTYGRVIDIVLQKGKKMKGQAFLVFSDLAEATAAMRACEGLIFYDKPLHIHYAKTKSYAVLRREDPDFVPPNPANSSSRLQNGSSLPSSSAEKRSREDDVDMTDRRKRERADVDEEMEVEEEEPEENPTNGNVPVTLQKPSARLLVTNLPQQVTDDMLSVLFQQYRGFLSVHVAQSQTPNANDQKVKMAQVIYDTADLASVAKEALDGFKIDRGWKMAVAYM